MTDVDWHDGRITEQGLKELVGAIGVRRSVPGWNRLVTPETIEHFALGIGDDNPLWWDDAHAAGSPWGSRIAPPCYLHSHLRGPRLRDDDGASATAAFLPGVFSLVTGERWRWMRPVRAGETIVAEAALVEASPHHGAFGGPSVTQVERNYLMTEAGEVVAELDHVQRRFERREARVRRSYLDRPLAAWTAEDRDTFRRQYEAETHARRGAEPRDIRSVRVGDALGPMLKGPLTITNLIGFLLGAGSPNAPTNRMTESYVVRHPGAKVIHPETGAVDTMEAPHWEASLAKASGLPGGYDFSRQRASWLSHLLTDWAGDHGFLAELDVAMRRPNIIGDVTWLTGEVVAIDEVTDTVSIALKAANQLAETTATAMAKVRLPRESLQ